MNETPNKSKRPWYRLHASTIVVACLLAVGLCLIVLPGELVGQIAMHFKIESFEHGWPWVFLERTVTTGPASPAVETGVPWLRATGWSLEATDGKRVFTPWALALDLLTVGVVLGLGTAAVEYRGRRRARLFQFSLAEFVVVLVAAAVLLAVWRTYRVQWLAEHQAINEIIDLTRQYTIDDILDSASKGPMHFHRSRYSGPDWVAKLVGYDALPKELWTIDDFSGDENTNAMELQRILPHLAQLRSLRWLSLHGPVDDQAIQALAHLCDLEVLVLGECPVGDDAMEVVGQFSRLRELHLWGTHITDAGLAKLANLSALQTLDVSGTSATRDGIQRLQQALPHCEIVARQ